MLRRPRLAQPARWLPPNLALDVVAAEDRMLGSLADADDAVQEAWLRVARADASEVGNLSAWLTTIVARVCLNALRSRNARREEPLDTHVPDPVITRADGPDPSNSPYSPNPEDQALLADSVGLALQVVLETLTPAERLAFVLHDTFGLPFEEIAPMLGRSPTAMSPASGRWSTRSSPRRTAATSARSSRSSTRTWCPGSTRERGP
jgi:RNA polymerase sigma factor (sigma-70 family)